jgi:hypothetical protein
MTALRKRYWVVDVTKGIVTVFRKRLPGNLSTGEIATILQRLASRDLTPGEVIAASIRKPRKTHLLDARIDGPPHGKRVMVWLPECPDYKAGYWREDELSEYPDILGDD